MPLLDRVWELRGNLTPYDAAYVALAERLRIPLLTADQAIAAAPGVRCKSATSVCSSSPPAAGML